MEPERWFNFVGHFFVPSKNGVGFSCHKSPVDSHHFFLFEYRHNGLERATVFACHIFGADERTVEGSQRVDARLREFGIFVAVKRDNVGVSHLKIIKFFQFLAPNSRSDRL